jgi:hypothetical protein
MGDARASIRSFESERLPPTLHSVLEIVKPKGGKAILACELPRLKS